MLVMMILRFPWRRKGYSGWSVGRGRDGFSLKPLKYVRKRLFSPLLTLDAIYPVGPWGVGAGRCSGPRCKGRYSWRE